MGDNLVVFGDRHLDLNLEIREAGEERIDRCLLTLTSTELVVVDEVIGQEPGAGARVPLVDRLFIETADQLYIFGGTH